MAGASLAPRKILVMGALVAAFTVGASTTPAMASPITLSAFSTNINAPIGIDYQTTSNSVIVSYNYPGFPGFDNFLQVSTIGAQAAFGPSKGLLEEIKIATAKTTIGGWTAGEFFTGNGHEGEVDWFNPDGTLKQTWHLGLATGIIRGSLFVDESATALYGNDLIVVTTGGDVWRIDSAAPADCSSGCTKLASVNRPLEGVNIVPNLPAWGPYAGKIIAGAGSLGGMYVFDNDPVTPPTFEFDVFRVGGESIEIEDIDLIIPNARFLGVDYGANVNTGRLLGADASYFTASLGHFLITEEDPHSHNITDNASLWDLSYNAVTGLLELNPFIRTGGEKDTKWEHVTFAPFSSETIPTPEPASLALFGTGLCGLALRYRRRLRRG